MNNYLLFEVGVEELPSRFVSSTLDQIKNNLTKLFNENRITFDNIETYGTPRRLTFIVKGISDRQSDLEEEVKEFYKVFYNYELSNSEISEMMKYSTGNAEQTASSPVPILGVLAGLSAAVILRRR